MAHVGSQSQEKYYSWVRYRCVTGKLLTVARDGEWCKISKLTRIFFLQGARAPSGPGPPHYRGFTITLNDALHSVGLLWASDQPDTETSTWQHTTLKRETSMPPAIFEPTIPTSELPQTHTLEGVVTGISEPCYQCAYFRCVPASNYRQAQILYGVIKKSLCAWWLQ
jgi:hypothetical protein